MLWLQINCVGLAAVVHRVADVDDLRRVLNEVIVGRACGFRVCSDRRLVVGPMEAFDPLKIVYMVMSGFKLVQTVIQSPRPVLPSCWRLLY